MILRRLATSIRKQDWLAVVVEAVVALGIVGLIAITHFWLNARSELLEWQSSEEKLEKEILINYLSAKKEIAVAPCRTRAYSMIAQQLSAPGEEWSGLIDTIYFGARQPSSPFGAAMLQSHFPTVRSSLWENANLVGAEAQGENASLDYYVRLNERFRTLIYLQEETGAIVKNLNLLSEDRTLSAGDRQKYLALLAELGSQSEIIRILSDEVVAEVERRGIGGASEHQEALEELIAGVNRFDAVKYGDCFIRYDASDLFKVRHNKVS